MKLINYRSVWWLLPSNERKLRAVYLYEEGFRWVSCYRPVLFEPSALNALLACPEVWRTHPSPPVACYCDFRYFSVFRFMCKRKHQTFTCFIVVSMWRFRWSAGRLKQFCVLRHGNSIEVYFLKHVVRFALCFLRAGKEVKVCCDVLQWYTAYCFLHTRRHESFYPSSLSSSASGEL